MWRKTPFVIIIGHQLRLFAAAILQYNLWESENMDNMKPEEKERGAVGSASGNNSEQARQKSILTPQLRSSLASLQ